MSDLITAEELRALLDYDADTGHLRWKVPINSRVRVGEITGSNSHGYLVIRIYGRLYPAHRLAWLHTFGVWPKNVLDHINGNESDNRISNLREATQSQNSANRRMRSDNTSGYKGVHFVKNAVRKRWMATIGVSGKKRYLGHFLTSDEAHAAYQAAAAEHFGEFARSA